MRRPLLLLFLPACIGLEALNPSDTGSIGPGPGRDSGPTNTDTGTPANYSRPVVESFSVQETTDNVRMDFRLSDADNDMEGGKVEIDIGQRGYTFFYPNDVPQDSNGAYLLFEKNIFTPDQAVKCTIRAYDARGLESAASSTNFILQVGDITVDENGDTVSDVTNLGMLNPPVTISGTIWGSGNDGVSEYTADKDFVYFQVPYTGQFRFSLSWEPVSADYDLILYSESGLLGAAQSSYNNPEIIGPQALTANTNYGFGVYAWDGGAGNWTLQIQ